MQLKIQDFKARRPKKEVFWVQIQVSKHINIHMIVLVIVPLKIVMVNKRNIALLKLGTLF